ncbi:DUF2269 family protein [Paenibacillus sp. HB172176]|uniref:DUF2269 family protein n=1 Tax=Paenibacillus sp. HB172176 TaxID=2493690 RepID=UPI00143925E7|nr:DUF2269 family protein [Paenibacillus sp. HB172176]
MEWLVVIHVVSAFLGIGPTYFGHVLFRRSAQTNQLKQSLALMQTLNYFPKIGGSIAVVSGVLLVALMEWRFVDPWILLSLILYVIIQIIVVGMLSPEAAKLDQLLKQEETGGSDPARTVTRTKMLARINRLYEAASLLGIVLLILMVMKPYF